MNSSRALCRGLPILVILITSCGTPVTGEELGGPAQHAAGALASARSAIDSVSDDVDPSPDETAVPDRPSPRHYLIFIADDQGEGDLGCYGHPVIRTPNIDRLAAGGVRFRSAFLATSSCSPSRSSTLTGRYPHRTGAEDLHVPLPRDQHTVARYLHDNGYHTAAVGKWHLGAAERDHWDRVVECRGRDTGPRAVELLRDRPADRPFFFWVASVDPHRPFDEDAVDTPYDPSTVVVPPFLPDHPLIRRDIADYYGEITRFDEHVGLVLAELERQGILDETFIVYLSDNGMPFPRAKTTLYDSGIRTPLIIRYPPLAPAGRIRDGLVSTIDIAPTILDLAGIEAQTMDGRSFVPLLTSLEAPARSAIFAEANWHDFEKFTRAVRTERFLLIRNYYWDAPLWSSVDSVNSPTWRAILEERRRGTLTPAQELLFREPREYEELYDLQRDPSSLRNVAGDSGYEAALHALRIRLDNWRVNTQDTMPAERRRDGWTRDGRPLPHNQPWYDRWKKRGRNDFESF